MAVSVRPAAATDDRVLAAYRRLGSAYAAAAALGVGASTVYRVLRAHRVKATGRQRFTPTEVARLVREFRAGASVAQLAARYDEEPNKVRRALVRSGVVMTPDPDGRRRDGPREGDDRRRDRRPHTFTQRQLRAIAAAYRAGATVAELVRRFGGSRYHVERALARAGVERRPRRDGSGELAEIRELAARGLSLRKIGAAVGRSHRFVWLVLNRAKV